MPNAPVHALTRREPDPSRGIRCAETSPPHETNSHSVRAPEEAGSETISSASTLTPPRSTSVAPATQTRGPSATSAAAGASVKTLTVPDSVPTTAASPRQIRADAAPASCVASRAAIPPYIYLTGVLFVHRVLGTPYLPNS
eukprot:scaffold104600_cov34-Tisochrysis_lutea.AAC.1